MMGIAAERRLPLSTPSLIPGGTQRGGQGRMEKGRREAREGRVGKVKVKGVRG